MEIERKTQKNRVAGKNPKTEERTVESVKYQAICKPISMRKNWAEIRCLEQITLSLFHLDLETFPQECGLRET